MRATPRSHHARPGPILVRRTAHHLLEHTAQMMRILEAHLVGNWKSHATLPLLAKQDLPTFGYNMIDPLKSWCWGSILFYPFKISRFS